MKYLLAIPVFLLFFYEFRVGLLEGFRFIIHIGIISSIWLILAIVAIVIKTPFLIFLFFLIRGLIFFVCFINAFIVKKVTKEII